MAEEAPPEVSFLVGNPTRPRPIGTRLAWGYVLHFVTVNVPPSGELKYSASRFHF
jgi:hypothetical protein